MSSPTDNYYSLFSQLIDYAPISILSLFFLCLFRLAPIIAISPFLGARLPSGVKMGLMVALAVIFLPHLAVTSKTLVGFNMIYICLLVKELFIGMILSFLASLPFFMAQSAGVLIDFQRGASSLQVTDPFMQQQVSDIGLLYYYVMIVLFYQLNGPVLFFEAILSSYDIIPADGWINPNFFHLKHPIWQVLSGSVGKLFAMAIQLCAPCLLAILMTELFLGIANRLAPQVQIVFLGMSLKSLAALALLCVGWFFIVQQLGKESLIWIKDINKLLPTMR